MNLVSMLKQQTESLENIKKAVNAVKESGSKEITDEEFAIVNRYIRAIDKPWNIALKIAKLEEDLKAKNGKTDNAKSDDKDKAKPAEKPVKETQKKAKPADTAKPTDDAEDDDLDFLN